MKIVFAPLRHPIARWVLGLAIAAAAAALLWLGREPEPVAPPPSAGTSAIDDVLPPADADADPAPPPEPTGQSGDIIPPQEP